MRSVTLLCLLLLPVVVLAQPWMAMSYEGVPWGTAHTNIDIGVGEYFTVYVVLFDTGEDMITGYEMSYAFDPAAVMVLSSSGPDGWVNAGDDQNHRYSLQEPLPMTANDEVVLATLGLWMVVDDTIDILMGPADPSSVDGAGPALANGAGIWRVCDIPGNWDDRGLVATINGDGVTVPSAVEGRTWSAVKQLFQPARSGRSEYPR